jgi:hypothetical protein
MGRTLAVHHLKRPASEAELRVAECALREGEHRGGCYGEDEDRLRKAILPDALVEGPVAHDVLPLPVPFPAPRLREAPEHLLVGHRDGVAFDDDVDAGLPGVTARRQDHVRMSVNVGGFLLVGSGTEMEGIVGPHGDERSDVRSAVASNCADPEQLSGLEDAAGLLPICGDRLRIAVTLVKPGNWRAHEDHPLPSMRILYTWRTCLRRHCADR